MSLSMAGRHARPPRGCHAACHVCGKVAPTPRRGELACHAVRVAPMRGDGAERKRSDAAGHSLP